MTKFEVQYDNRSIRGEYEIGSFNDIGAVIVHSFRNTMDTPVCKETYDEMIKRGYSALRFNMTGHGDDSENIDKLSYNVMAQDVDVAVRFLQQQKVSKIALFGISLGTAASLLCNFNPKCYVMFSPVFDYTSLYNRYKQDIEADPNLVQKNGKVLCRSGSGRSPFYMGIDWIGEMRNPVDLVEIYNSLKTPTLIYQATRDEISGMKNFDRINNPFVKIRLIEQANHDFTEPSVREPLIQEAVDFMIEKLNS